MKMVFTVGFTCLVVGPMVTLFSENRVVAFSVSLTALGSMFLGIANMMLVKRVVNVLVGDE